MLCNAGWTASFLSALFTTPIPLFLPPHVSFHLFPFFVSLYDTDDKVLARKKVHSCYTRVVGIRSVVLFQRKLIIQSKPTMYRSFDSTDWNVGMSERHPRDDYGLWTSVPQVRHTFSHLHFLWSWTECSIHMHSMHTFQHVDLTGFVSWNFTYSVDLTGFLSWIFTYSADLTGFLSWIFTYSADLTGFVSWNFTYSA